MATLTIRNIPDDAKQRLREVAAAHGRSMEEHLRQMIVEAGHAGAVPEIMASGVNDMRPSFGHAPVTDPRPDPHAVSRARIERLVELGRGLDWQPPEREAEPFAEPDWLR